MSGMFVVAWSPIKNVFLSFAYNFLLILDKMVYTVLTWVYQIFYMLTEVNLFNNNNAISEITERIYVVLGVVMLFVFAYNIIILLTNPDKLSKDNSLTKIIRDTVISLVLIAFLPTLFNLVYSIQSRVLETNVIGNIILGGSSIGEGSEESPKQSIKKAGNRVATSIFTTFYHPLELNGTEEVDITALDCRNGNEHALCSRYIEAIDSANSSDDFNALTPLFNDETLRDGVIDGNMKYMFIISTICGCIAVYLFASFAFDIGVRAVKLAILQLVAPVPIMLRITKPTGGIFSKWLKELKDTYLSLFVRLAIIYFAIFTIDLVWRSKDLFSIYDQYGGGVLQTVAELVLILSILAFAKEAPKLLKNIAGGSGNIEWNIKKKLNGENYEYSRRAMGAAGTIGRNVGRGLFNSVFQRNQDGTYSMHNAGSFGKAIGRNLRNIPKGLVYGAYRGWQNSGGNIENLGQEIKKSSIETTNKIDKSEAFRERAKETAKIGNVSFGKIPGIRDLITRKNDLNYAIETEGGISNYLGNRINYTTSGVSAEKAGTFRKHQANLVDSDLIQDGIKNIKEQYTREEEHLRENYNNQNIALNRRKNKIIEKNMSYKTYADSVESVVNERNRIKKLNKDKDIEALMNEETSYQTSYVANKKTLFENATKLENRRNEVLQNTTLSKESREATLKSIDKEIEENNRLMTNLVTEKEAFEVRLQDRIQKIKTDKQDNAIALATINRLEETRAKESKLFDGTEGQTSIGNDIREIVMQKTINNEFLSSEKKALDAKKKEAIRDKYTQNLTKYADDIRAYYVNNAKEIRGEFSQIPVSAQNIILEEAGFNPNEPGFNPTQAFNELGQIILDKNYDEDTVGRLMGFFKGLKRVENRGPFDYRISRMQDATSGKKDGDKK